MVHLITFKIVHIVHLYSIIRFPTQNLIYAGSLPCNIRVSETDIYRTGNQ